MGKMVAEIKGILVLCSVPPDGQMEARKKQRTQGADNKNLKYVLADSALWTNSRYYVACRVGKIAVLNCAASMHTNCKMPM